MSRSVRMVGAVLIPAFTLPLATGNVARAAVPSPPTNNSLPSGLDIASPYVPQSVCDPTAKPGVTAFARLMANHYDEYSYGISRQCNYGLTEHSEGRALDWMLNAYDPHERAVADGVISWLLAPDAQGRPAAMARRFGIMYIIWDRQIWGTYQMSSGWRPYNGVSPHTDHIHFSFSWDGAMQRTSWWTGKPWMDVTRGPGGPTVPITPPASYPTLREGAAGPDVVLAQKVLGVTADGAFGPGTKSALISWQRRNGVSATGVLDSATWNKMVALGEIPARGDSTKPTSYDSVRRGSTGDSVKELQRILGLPVDGVFGSGTDEAVRAFQKKKSLRVDGFVTSNVWKALKGEKYVKNGTPPKPAVTIPDSVRKGSRGAAVKELQKILGLTADGVFGSGTDKAVRAFQKKKSLRVDGFVTSNVWKALKGEKYVKNGTPPKPAVTIPDSVRKGSRGAAVKELQGLLNMRVSGVFGPGTDEAVRAFQKKKSLRVDGFVTSNVWKALKGEKYVKNGTPPKPAVTIPDSVRKGSRGAAVKELQKILGLTADGVFGSGTDKAVRAFQKKKSLRVDGFVTSNVWKALKGEKYVKNGTPPKPAVTIPDSVRKGSRGAAVKELQGLLNMRVSGVFGPGTDEAVRAFQKKKSLRVDGFVTSNVWKALKGEKYVKNGTPPKPAVTIPDSVRKGSRGAAVKELQKILGLTADGVFGSGTDKAVRAFQKKKSLRVDGFVTSNVWKALKGEKYVKNGTPPKPAVTIPDSVRKGSRGAAVKELQGLLNMRVSGVFGPGTDEAVRAFQKKKSLRVDGFVTSNVWKALKGEKYVKNGTPPKPAVTIPDSVRKGSRGAAVKELQKILGLTADGVFGSGTDKAVRAFQKKKSLRVDGFVTSNVWKALKGEKYVKNGTPPKPAVTIPDSVRKGSRGAAVKELQKILGLTADGVFGSGTDKAVRAFQKKKSLRVDGFVTSNVWKALKGEPYVKNGSTASAARSSLAPAPNSSTPTSTPAPKSSTPTSTPVPKSSTPTSTPAPKSSTPTKEPTSTSSSSRTAATTVKTDTEFTPLKSTVLAEGSRSRGVKSVQRAVGGVAVDGAFGHGTTKAVRSFQRSTGLEPTGIVDESTWDALEEKKYPFLKYRTTVLKPGSTGPAVEALQTYLGLPADGTYDASMEESIKTVQKQHGLTRTGYVGSVTWEALEREVRSRH
ncbi:peptidoglycan-binding protein [Janibacter sp. GS2]|uniref:peptidoglycan-binding domain-containing protein n=1 Tax=Janibacter sp. GS2 TaxID=3442646 RepID=UPI003EB7A037